MSNTISIIIPTKDRSEAVKRLLNSIREVRGIDHLQPEIIVGDNDSKDSTWDTLQREMQQFPSLLRSIRVTTPGKSSVLNEAIRASRGDLLAFVDDDVVVDAGWLLSIKTFFQTGKYQAGQGVIRIQAPDNGNAEIQRLIDRYRTIPNLDFGPHIQEVHSLNGANFAVSRKAIE